MIDAEDEKKINKSIYDVVILALQDVVFPRFDKLEDVVGDIKSDVGSLTNDVDSLKSDVGELKEKVDNLTQAVEILDNDMGGVKNETQFSRKKARSPFLPGLLSLRHLPQSRHRRPHLPAF